MGLNGHNQWDLALGTDCDTGMDMKLLRSGMGDSSSSSDTGWMQLMSIWHCCLSRLSFFTLELLMMIVSTSVFIRLIFPMGCIGIIDMLDKGGVRDTVGPRGCFPLAPVGQGTLLTMMIMIRLMVEDEKLRASMRD